MSSIPPPDRTPGHQVTQAEVNQDQENVRKAAQNGGNVDQAVAVLMQDQAALTGDKSSSIADTKAYMDQFLKNAPGGAIDTTAMDKAFDKFAAVGQGEGPRTGADRRLDEWAGDFAKDVMKHMGPSES